MTTTETIAPTLRLECPSWCAGDGRHADTDQWRAAENDAGPTLLRDHPGPRFGPFLLAGEQDALSGAVVITAFVDLDDDLTADEVRDLAKHLADAVAWLEAQQ